MVQRKSDVPLVVRKWVTPMERRGTHAGDRSMAPSTTRRGGKMATTGVERIAQRARQEPHTRYTALMHHFTVDNLRVCFVSLDGKQRPESMG